MKLCVPQLYTILLLIVTYSGLTQSQDMFDPRFLTYPGIYPYQNRNNEVQGQMNFRNQQNDRQGSFQNQRYIARQEYFQNQVETPVEGQDLDGRSNKRPFKFDETVKGLLDMIDVALNVISTNPIENILAYIDLIDLALNKKK